MCVKEKNNSKAGNRTRVSCVTGKNTNHYTTSEGLVLISHGYRVESRVLTIEKKLLLEKENCQLDWTHTQTNILLHPSLTVSEDGSE